MGAKHRDLDRIENAGLADPVWAEQRQVATGLETFSLEERELD
jgi:hypothetical protein